MRPRGEISRATLQAAWDLAKARAHEAVPGATYRDIQALLVPQGIGRQAVRDTVKNLRRLGHLQPVGPVRVAGSPRALVAYAPTTPQQAAASRQAEPGLLLAGITRAWVG